MKSFLYQRLIAITGARPLRPLGLLLLALLFAGTANAQSVSFTVTTLTDDAKGVPGNCNQTQGGTKPSSNCSLRDAVAAVEALKSARPVTINFDPSLASVSTPATYTLGSGGTLLMYSSVNIVGPGPLALTVSGDNKYQIFVFAGGTVSVSGLTLTKGQAGNGGAIQSYVDLTVDNCILSANSVSDGGGAIESQGPTLHVTNSIITGNSAQVSGGLANSGSSATIDNSTVSNNTALDGGGIESDSPMSVTNSVISGNSATLDDGGGINNYGGTLSIDHSYFLGNTAAARGGGLFTLNLTTAVSNSVISGNSAPANPGQRDQQSCQHPYAHERHCS